ncbi:hypothetical protein BT69DRAFT_1089994 [Atractiella rhizophila]|nr:hypothetical protein BT69DRAFT_1089994 [Atractiella rhizophila]
MEVGDDAQAGSGPAPLSLHLPILRASSSDTEGLLGRRRELVAPDPRMGGRRGRRFVVDLGEPRPAFAQGLVSSDVGRGRRRKKGRDCPSCRTREGGVSSQIRLDRYTSWRARRSDGRGWERRHRRRRGDLSVQRTKYQLPNRSTLKEHKRAYGIVGRRRSLFPLILIMKPARQARLSLKVRLSGSEFPLKTTIASITLQSVISLQTFREWTLDHELLLLANARWRAHSSPSTSTWGNGMWRVVRGRGEAKELLIFRAQVLSEPFPVVPRMA